MTTKMANVIYKNNKLGNINVSENVMKRIYLEATTDMTYANMYNNNLEQDRKNESLIIENLFNGNYGVAQELLNKQYAWVK